MKKEKSNPNIAAETKKNGSGERMALLAKIWGKQKATRLNKLINLNYCGQMTVRDLVSVALADTMNFPHGLDTPLCIGDFEGNFCTNVLGVAMGGDKSDHICVMGDPHGDMK